MIKNIILLTLLCSTSIFAEDIPQLIGEEGKQTCYQTCYQVEEYDISHWTTVPISFGSINGDSHEKEDLIISFPSEPEFSEVGFLAPSFTATDDEKMIYTIASMDLNGGNYSSMHDGVDFVVNCLAISSSKNFLGVSELDPNSNRRTIFWSENDQMNTLEFVQGSHFVYILGTTAQSEFYKNIEELDEESQEYKELFRNGAKTRAFFKSFKIN